MSDEVAVALTEAELTAEQQAAAEEHAAFLRQFAHHDDPNLTFREKIRRVLTGLKCPKESGEYKWAAHEVQHLYSLGAAFVLPGLCLLLLTVMVTSKHLAEAKEIEVQMLEPETVDELKIEPEQTPPPETEVVEVPVDAPDSAFTAVSDFKAPNVATPLSQQPAEVTSVRMIKSPVVMRGVYGNRTPGTRGKAIGQYGGSGGGEDAVVRALRWLKFNQNPDGSWDMGCPKAAATGLALLCYLAHGEAPGASSPEFGDTVRKGIEALIYLQKEDGNFNETGSHHVYGNGIAAYAMCEAAAMTKISSVREAAEKAIKVVIEGQQAGGGWDYGYSKGARTDTSVMAWQMQALKAAYMAGLEAPGLHEAMERSVKGMKGQAGDYGFGYTSPGNSALTAAGTLCMMLMNAGGEPEAQRGKATVSEWSFDWANPFHARALYHWYYGTQVRFHSGGEIWNKWNAQFSPQLVKAQVVVPTPDSSGKKMGHWTTPGGAGAEASYGNVYSTTLCCLMLEVYYRYLPTYQTPEGANLPAEKKLADPKKDVGMEFEMVL